MNKVKVRYDLNSAPNGHPAKRVKELGMEIYTYEGKPISDCVIMEVTNIPDKLPDYIEIIENE